MGISHEYHSAHTRAKRSRASFGLRLAGVIAAILLLSLALTMAVATLLFSMFMICKVDYPAWVGFEPTVPLPVHLISSQGRYNHFDTAPYVCCSLSIIAGTGSKIKEIFRRFTCV